MTREGTRRLAAVWFADVVGYTALSKRDEDLALRVVRELQRIARMQCDARGGRVVKFLGDAVLAVFDSADGAVRASVGLRDGFLQSPEAKAAGVSLRVGLHLGDVTEAVDGDVYGDAVNAASRIETVAQPGQVLISDIAYRLLQQRATLEVEDLGEQDLKGLGPVRLYAASLAGESDALDLRELLQAELAPLQLLDTAGLGGMGEIYLARDPRLRRTLAVKVLRSELVSDKQARARFQREAQVIAGLSHPNVISIHTVGELKDGTPYFVMDYVEGGSLADRLERDGPISVPEARRILGEVASALQAAHAKGIIHRDIKPGNVLWDAETGRALVTDWGIAALDRTFELGPEERLTSTGMFVGSPQYMSPEQLAGDDIGPETDIYALGLLAFELLTGQGPFRGDTPRQIMIAQLREDPPSLSTLREGVDPELESLVARCLSKSPGARPSASEMARLAPGAAASIEWPPPGLEKLRGTARGLAVLLGSTVASAAAAVVLMLFLVAMTGPGLRPAPSPAGFWVFMVSLLFLYVLVPVNVVWCSILVVRAIAALRLGYGWRTLVEVMADSRGDAGMLISGGREYSVLGQREQRQLRRRRVARTFLLVPFAVALPIALVIIPSAIVLSGWTFVLVAVAFTAPVALLQDPRVVEKARRRFAQVRGSKRHRKSLAESWNASVADRHPELASPGGGVARWLLPAATLVTGLAGTSAACVVGLFAGGVVIATSFWDWTSAGLGEPMARWEAVAPFQYLRLPADPAVTPAEAGRVLREMVSQGDSPAGRGAERPSPESLGESRLATGPGLRTAGFPLRTDSLVSMALVGILPREEAYLKGFSADPRLAQFRRAARAEGIDWYDSSPLSDGAVAALQRAPDWGVLRTLALENLATAAYQAGIGDLAGAEETLRENLSLGFLLAQGTDLSMFNLGIRILVEPALDGLAPLLERRGRREDATAIRARAVGLPQRVVERRYVSKGKSDAYRWAFDDDTPLYELARTVGDAKIARALRWTALAYLVPGTVCTDPRALLTGRADGLDRLVEELRATLVQYPSEEDLLEMLAGQVEQLHAAMADSVPATLYGSKAPLFGDVVPLIRFSSALLGNPRLDACVTLLGSM